MGALVFLVEQRELLGALREAGVELLQTDDVGVLAGDQLQDVVDAAAAVLAVETADVVGHHPERPAVVNGLPVITAADFGPPEKRDFEKPRHDDRQHHQGPHLAPTDDPVEHQHHRRDIDAGRGEPQHGEEPDPGGIEVRTVMTAAATVAIVRIRSSSPMNRLRRRFAGRPP